MADDTPIPATDADLEARSFHCPRCGANLKPGNQASVTCEYCGATVIVPEELRPRRQPPIRIQPPEQRVIRVDLSEVTRISETTRRRAAWIFAASIAAVILIGVLAAAIGLLTTGVALNSVVESISTPGAQGLNPLPPPGTTPTPEGPYRLALSFGEPGRQPGQLDDARYIALDSQGNIYTADYSGGRINVFDPAGNFLRLIQVEPPEGPADSFSIFGMAISAADRLFVSRQGLILRYDPADGRLEAALPDRWPEISFDALAAGPDGQLYSENGMAGADEVVIFSPQGEVQARWEGFIEKVNRDDPAISIDLAVDGGGGVYALSSMGAQAYLYDASGRFLLSFGEEGDAPGQLTSFPTAIAVDGSGKIYIASAYRVDVFDNQGRYLERSLELAYDLAGGVLRDLAVDADGRLYLVTAGGKVLVFEPNLR